MPQILYYFRMIGHWTFSFHMFFKDVGELNQFLSLLREKGQNLLDYGLEESTPNEEKLLTLVKGECICMSSYKVQEQKNE